MSCRPDPPALFCGHSRLMRSISNVSAEQRHGTLVLVHLSGPGSPATTPAANLARQARVTRIAERWGGRTDVFVDGLGKNQIVAMFGIPAAIERAPQHAINAAIEIREAFASETIAGGFAVRVAVDSGRLMVAKIRTGSQSHYRVGGEALAEAFALAEAASSDQILVDAETHRLTKDDYDYDLSSANLGREGLAAHEVLSRRPSVKGDPLAEGRMTASRAVGREQEINAIRRRLADLIAFGNGGTIAIIGEAGIGKSRILAEVLRTEEFDRVTGFEGRCTALGRELSFHPIVDLIQHLAGIEAGDPEAAAFEKLRLTITDLVDEEAQEVLPFVARMMSVQPTGQYAERVSGIDGEALEKLIHRSIRELLKRLALRNPTVIAVEDIHWADQSSLKLLEVVLPLVLDFPILFVFVSRPPGEGDNSLLLELTKGRYANYHLEISLAPLSSAQSYEVVRQALQISHVPREVRLAADKAEGNPLFIEELLRSWIEIGALERSGATVRVDDNAAIGVPNSVEDLVMARVDRLDAAVRRTLQIASVVGRSFSHDMIATVAGSDADLSRHLEVLCLRNLLKAEEEKKQHGTPSRQPRREFTFSHALIQDAVYNSILEVKKQTLHRNVAQSIEDRFADQLHDFYGVLAHHFSRAQESAKAERYAMEAGYQAMQAAAFSEALQHFRTAEAFHDQLYPRGGARKADLQRNLALALMNTGKLSESISYFDSALESYGDKLPQGSSGLTLQLLRDAVPVLVHLFEPATLRKLGRRDRRCQTSLQVRYNRIKAQSTSDTSRLFPDYVGTIRRLNRTDPECLPGVAVGLYGGFAALFAYSGISFRIGRRYLDIARSLCRPGHAKDIFDYQSLSFIHDFLEGKWDEERTVPDSLVEEATRFGGFWEINTYLGLDCDRRLRRGEFPAARELLERLRAMSESYGYEFAEDNRRGMTALLELERRNLDAALEAADLYEGGCSADTQRVLALGTKAKIQTLRGDLEATGACLQAADRVLESASTMPAWHMSAYHLGKLFSCVATLETLAREKERPSAALRREVKRSVRAALRIARMVSVQRTEAFRLAGTAAMHLGRKREAMHHWSRSIEAGRALGALPELARTYAEVGQWLSVSGTTLGDGKSAQEYLGLARSIFEELRLTWDLDRLEKSLASQ